MSKQQKKDHRKASLTRRQGVREIKQSFLIVCEGEKTEPDYFKAFRMTAATVMRDRYQSLIFFAKLENVTYHPCCLSSWFSSQ